MPGSTPATSQLDWLSSTTAMIVLSWSKATRDLLKSFSWGITALRQLFASDDGAISSPPAPYHLPVPRVLEPSQFIRFLDTAFAFCRRDRRRIGDRSHLPQALKRKELDGLPIAVGCTRPKTGRVPCLHIRWAEQCEPDILLYCSPYKCFPLEKTGCNPS